MTEIKKDTHVSNIKTCQSLFRTQPNPHSPQPNARMHVFNTHSPMLENYGKFCSAM